MAHHPLAGHVLPLRPTSVLFNMDLNYSSVGGSGRGEERLSKRLWYKSDCRLSRRGDLSSKWRRRLPSMRATRPSPISRSHLPPRNVLPARAVCERARVRASLPIRGPAPVPSQPRQVLAPCRAARPRRATIAVARDRRCTQLHSLLSACRWHATLRTCATTCLSSAH